MRLLNTLRARFGIMGELLVFLWENKLWWMIPMVIVLCLFAVLLILGQNPVTAPFIYTLF